MVARLEAEQAGVPFVPRTSDRFQAAALADWNERQAEYRQSLNNYDSQIASTTEVRARALEDARNYQQDYNITTDLEQRMVELEKSGYGAAIKNSFGPTGHRGCEPPTPGGQEPGRPSRA